MVNKVDMLICALLLCTCATSTLWASPEDDVVAAYLKQHNMLSLLETQLEERITQAKNKDERVELSEQLSRIYLDQLQKLAKDDPYRKVILIRASQLTQRMQSMPMYELRIELLIERYVAIEKNVELHRLRLLDASQMQDTLLQLQDMTPQLRTLATQIDSAIEQNKRIRTKARSNPQELAQRLTELRRYRSLAHYYHAWTGYSIAALKDQHVPTDVYISFGWLLGAKGEMPQIALLSESTLNYEHVARSAIGLALAYAQSGDSLSARAWAKLVANSEYTDPDSKRVAEDRLLQIMAEDRDWKAVNRLVETLTRTRTDDSILTVANARYLALQSLEAMGSSAAGEGGIKEAKKTARFAIEQLVNAGEIGHVLDLYRRFDSLPLVADSFITNYAQALADLEEAENAGAAGMYASVATKFAQAMEASDAARFPNELDDCQLKLVYCEIRSGRAGEATKMADKLIKKSSKEQVIEEARWLRIAAMDSVNRTKGKSRSDELDQAAKEYITAYPNTSRSAQLIIRYAMQGSLDPQVAINTLESVPKDDPFALPARRTLIELRYKSLRANRFADHEQAMQVLDLINWILKNDTNPPQDINDARAKMGPLRIGIDIALRISPPQISLANQLLDQANQLVEFDPSMELHRSELIYRQIEIAVLKNQKSKAAELIAQLNKIDQVRAQNARIVLYNSDIADWNKSQSVQLARRIIEMGSAIFSQLAPPDPQPVGIQASKVGEQVIESASFVWKRENDLAARDLAYRVSLIILSRGQPSEPGLRKIIELTNELGDQENQLESWLRLLAAYPTDDSRWYEARYYSLKGMLALDPQRARTAFQQYKALHPTPGPSPWGEQIESLFAGAFDASFSTTGDQP